MAEKKRVGLIGAGLMGHGIGKNIVTKGYGLTVLGHKNRQPIESLKGFGATEAQNAREVAANSDIVFLCVTGSPQVEDVVYRKDGLLEGVHAGLIVADCSTAEPSSTLKVAADIEKKGGRFADTPLTRTPNEAEAGKLGLMTGGDDATLKELRPVLDCFADTIIHAGGVSAGHRLKLINNFIALGTAAVVSEAVTAAAKANVSLKALLDIVGAGGANSVMFQRLMKVPLENDDTALKFAIATARKDLRYYTNMTEQISATSFIAESVHQSFILAENRGYAQRFVPRMIDFIAELNGIDVRKKN
ncbi:MAG TPA: NAD(P)-dependent oxidoreductase [Dongiaceae bacterium]|jgi:3-hydroxyisobutyrate dehydrogenase-like beta-hydroxyacid dehydrogenase|nr:NAD(P)-dependent oxidoreductase [Dongiaceae bacterium]